MTSLSIVMPVYNEEKTVAHAIDRVLSVDFPCQVELIVVNDGSSDATAGIIDRFAGPGVIVRHLPMNQGKGSAVRAGVRQARGTHVVILDSDLEYTPNDIPAMLMPVLRGETNHVFGTRIFGLNSRFTSLKFAVGGRATTLAANLLFDSCVTDMHTCLKLLPVADIRAMPVREKGFGLDSEIVAHLLHAGVRPYEVPISYVGRTIDEGKKISWRDGFECLRILLMTRLRRPVRLPVGNITPALNSAPTVGADRWTVRRADLTETPLQEAGLQSG
ncbi:MAG TPA: glycosyltransferase family 2 protein [Aeromicrobium sp.]|nr:glycosyltransferase family 2 protein [Aeromicrobium sp.]